MQYCLIAGNCNAPLGMEDGRITDDQISASTSYDENNALFSYGPENARLNRCKQNITSGAWSSELNDTYLWIQVDLMVPTWIVGVKTQGRHGNYLQWVTKFKVQYSENGMEWMYVQQNEEDIVSLSLFCFFFVVANKVMSMETITLNCLFVLI